VDQYGQLIPYAQQGHTEITLPLTSDYQVFAHYVPRDNLAGDFNADRQVNAADFALMARFYGMQCNSLKLDQTSPASVDINDLMKWIEFWLMDTQTIP
jgi:hypothetical protein